MTPKSVKRFSDQVMRAGRMIPKNVKRFSHRVMRSCNKCFGHE